MAKTKNILEDVVADFGLLRSAYEKAGLLSGRPGLSKKSFSAVAAYRPLRREFLLFDAVLRNRVARLFLIEVLSRHVVVFGGTNVGKSTIINILAESGVASVSPEGAHTRHAHVFATSTTPLFGENPYAFKSFVCSEDHSQTESDAAVYFKSYLVPGTIPENVALWDTPDCDAVVLSRYLASVVEAVSAADIVIYVTTVEKYTVQHIVSGFSIYMMPAFGLLKVLTKRRSRPGTRDPQATE